MPLRARIASFWRNRTQRDARDVDLDAELQAYVELLVAEKMRAGMDAERARRAALIEVGGVEQVKERVREVRIGAFLETVAQDMRYGVRALLRSPGFTVAALLALALGIGATAAIFSVVNAVLLRPLAYKDSDNLVVILHHHENPVSPANFLDWRRENTVFSSMGAADYWQADLTGDRPERVLGLKLTSDVLPMMGIQPLLGRLPTAQEDEPGRDQVAVLSYGLWQRRYAGDARVLGRSIQLDGKAYTVIGVMPRGFMFAPFWATEAVFWAPNAFGKRASSRNSQSLRVFARLKPGVTLEQARAEMASITARLDKEYPGTNRDVAVDLLKEKVVGGHVRTALLVLLGAVVFVLLIACANVAHMLLARAASRHKEMAVRTALGASRWRMVRQLLTESLLLGLVSGAAGLLLAFGGVRALVAFGPQSIPRLGTIGLDGRVLGFAVAVSLLTGVAFGLVPALHAARRGIGETLREGERGSTEGLRRNRLRSALIASEFALALVLLVGAGLMIRSFLALQRIDPGFNPHNVVSMVVSVTGSKEAVPGRRLEFFREVVQRVGSVPGVRSASAINHLPLAGDMWGAPFAIEGRPAAKPGETPSAIYRVVLPGYFGAMRIPILRGRDVAETDDVEATDVVVINQFMADRHFAGEDPIGRRMSFSDPDGTPEWATVIGVVKNTVRGEWAAPSSEEVFVPYLQEKHYLTGGGSSVSYLTIVVQTSPGGDAAAYGGAIRRAVADIDASVPVSEVQTMDEVVKAANGQPRFYLLLLATFAAIALILAALGIYGVMSYSVSRRTHEIGIRMALGAARADVVGLVVGQGMIVALIGATAGLVGALLLTRLMTTLLYGVRATDPLTFLGVSLVLVAVAFAASYLPARRATRIDPLVALRHE